MKGTKLIVLRGPSGSGKSSVAESIRSVMVEKSRVAYIEQDYWRRVVLKEKDTPKGLNIRFIHQTVSLCLENSYDVIMEGIFNKDRYEHIFKNLTRNHKENNYFFYFDISFGETLRRHGMRSKKEEFGEEEMKRWYKGEDFLNGIKEERIPESNTMNETVERILKRVFEVQV